MDLKIDNIRNVILVILGLIGLLGALYLVFMINGLVVGTTSQVATSGDLISNDNTSENYNPDMFAHINNMEGNYVTAANTLESRVSLALQIFGIIVILALFGLSGYFAYNKYKGGKSGGGF